MTDINKIPTWLTLTDEAAQVTLSYPCDINGMKVDQLTLRNPTIREVRAAGALSGDDDELRELTLFATLAEAGVKDLEGLKVRDYKRLQTATFAWCARTGFSPGLQKQLAKRLAVDYSFSAAEIETMPFFTMIWWLTD